MKKNIYFIIAISVVVLGVCVGVLKKNSEIVPSTSSVSVVDVSELATGPFTAMEILFEMDKKEKGTQLYYSEALGVGFTYKPFSDDYVPKITESGNKIRVGEYQSIEVFEKDSNVILEQAIKKQILKGLSDSECFVMFYEMGGNEVKDYTFAGISYPGEKGSNEPCLHKNIFVHHNTRKLMGYDIF